MGTDTPAQEARDAEAGTTTTVNIIVLLVMTL